MAELNLRLFFDTRFLQKSSPIKRKKKEKIKRILH